MIGPTIKEIRITPIATIDPPLLNSVGIHSPYALRTIIELVTHDNISGISEIPGNVDINNLLKKAGEVVLGADPFQLNKLRNDIFQRFGDSEQDIRGSNPWDDRKLVHVFSALEVACLDIQGKIARTTGVDLLGGRCRDEISFAAYLFYKKQGAGGDLHYHLNSIATGWEAARQAQAETPEEIVAQAKAMCLEFGFKSIKLKGGVFEPELELAAMQKLHEAFGPEVPLRFDPNGVWTVETSIEYGKKWKTSLNT